MPKSTKSTSPKKAASPKAAKAAVPENVEGYCVKCGKTVKIVDGKLAKTKNGRSMVKGRCENCKTVVCRFLPNPQ